MLYWLSKYISNAFPTFDFFRLVQYVSFRTIAASLTALFLALHLGPKVILFLHNRGWRDVPKGFVIGDSESKKGTPTMGGLLFLLGTLVSAILWCDLSNRFVQILLIATLYFACLGFWDDYGKVKIGKGEGGLSEVKKLFLQFVFGIGLALFIGYTDYSPYPDVFRTEIFLPFVKPSIYKGIDINIGIFYIAYVTIFTIFISNSVNISDGFDGLAIVPAVITTAVFAIFAYIYGTINLATGLLFRYFPGTTEITIFLAGFIGAGIGFLWFNCYPAQMFMGDTGSLTIGGMLATTAVLLKQEMLFLFAGAFFVAEGLSSQISDKIGQKFLGKRLFTRAPLHYALQHSGLSEPKVVVRAWILSFIIGLFALATVKLR
ncbi:MAG: phospho-N-acetylmuramoyl-pentapeptide-transferase [bacterium]|nr:phospho-N-acetylmuramoyl-pentapeptide-transferase [bacterium]